MISTKHQDLLCSWLCRRIGLVPTPHMRCIASMDHEGRILGVAGFDGYNHASVMMHVAGKPGWLSRSMLYAMFDYTFNVLGCNMVIGLIPSGNRESLRLARHTGFVVTCALDRAHPDGALFVMTMLREHCKYIKDPRYGKEVIARAPASA